VAAESRIRIERETDIVIARQRGRELAAARGFSSTEQTLIALAISEVARNIVVYAMDGEIILSEFDHDGHRGIMIVARDSGPGIANIELAMRDGYSTSKSLGVGLPGTKRIMDEFEIDSAPGRGTIVTMKKWLR
jgi:serine/threonine-protein kinase RsbT